VLVKMATANPGDHIQLPAGNVGFIDEESSSTVRDYCTGNPTHDPSLFLVIESADPNNPAISDALGIGRWHCVKIQNIRFKRNNGAVVAAILQTDASYLDIVHNDFDGNGASLDVFFVRYGLATNITIEYNLIHGSTGANGLNMSPDTRPATWVYSPGPITVRGNKFYDVAVDYFHDEGFNDVRIVYNWFNGTGSGSCVGGCHPDFIQIQPNVNSPAVSLGPFLIDHNLFTQTVGDGGEILFQTGAEGYPIHDVTETYNAICENGQPNATLFEAVDGVVATNNYFTSGNGFGGAHFGARNGNNITLTGNQGDSATFTVSVHDDGAVPTPHNYLGYPQTNVHDNSYTILSPLPVDCSGAIAYAASVGGGPQETPGIQSTAGRAGSRVRLRLR